MSSLLKSTVVANPPSHHNSSGSSPPQKALLRFSSATTATAQESANKLIEKTGTKAKAAKVTFKDLAGPTAINQALLDIAGVYTPKLIVLRSGFQFFEESFLEFVEDLAFYFSTAIGGFAAHKPMAKLAKLKEGLGLDKGEHAVNKIGQGLGGKTTEKNADGTDKVHRNLIAAKFGTVMAALGFGAGFEFMIQHTKNVLTAKQFHVKNFTAVAGLEDAQDKNDKGERDPVDKAKQRSKQTGALTLGVIGAALLSPLAIRHSKVAETAARKILGYVDFGKSKPFDLSKSFLAILAGVGAFSYIDASRDGLERKENATRLAVVIPYMLFGKELVMFALTKGHERFGVIQMENGATETIRKLKKDIGFSLTHSNPVKQAAKKETFLNMDVLRNQTQLKEHFDEVSKEWLKTHPEQTEHFAQLGKALDKDFASRLAAMKTHSFYLSAATTGILINLIAYSMTRQRYKNEKEKEETVALEQDFSTSTNPFVPNPNPLAVANSAAQTNEPTYSYQQTGAWKKQSASN